MSACGRVMCFYLLCCWCCALGTVCAAAAVTNVALNKPATQSTSHPVYGRPEKVVDGNMGTSVSQCTHTADVDNNPDRWWRVDLEGLYSIQSVVITNRGDCCGERLTNFDINVARDLSDPSGSSQDSSALCLHFDGQIPNGDTATLNCDQSTVGRYVTLVQNSSTEPLNVCEIQVLGVPVVLVMRANTFRRQSDQKAVGDVIKETYVRGVIHCTSECATESGCTAVNMRAGARRGQRRECQLLAYGGSNHPSALICQQGWDFYRLNTTVEDLSVIP